MRMVDVVISVSLAADEDTTYEQVREFIEAALERAFDKDHGPAPHADKFAYNGEPVESWTTA